MSCVSAPVHPSIPTRSSWRSPPALGAQPASKGGLKSIQPEPLKEWLTYIASDELQGRQIYTEGLGLAAAYIADHLKEWGVKPGGDNGSYFQTVKVVSVKATSHASVTVDVNGQSRTFKDGEGVLFAKNMGGKQTITGDQVEFVGYGLQIPSANDRRLRQGRSEGQDRRVARR